MTLTTRAIAGGAFALAAAAAAETIEYEGRLFEAVDWTAADPGADTAVGMVHGRAVAFTPASLDSPVIFVEDYTTDPAFDAVVYESGTAESLRVRAGAVGASTIDFGDRVAGVLMIIGAPNADGDSTQFGPALWDFPDDLDMEVIDTEGAPGLQLFAGNVLVNAGGQHVSGIVRIRGCIEPLAWAQDTSAGFDQTRITFAVSPACDGDVNGDGVTDSADLNIMLTNFGKAVAPCNDGDVGGDGLVDTLDLNALLSKFGADCQ